FFVYSKCGFNVRVSIVSVLFMTLFIEITQGFIPYRFCEIDDVLLNTLGGVIGVSFYFILIKIFPKKEMSKN
ncbi:MAG: VanZ family protein, partial [Peptostreptococcaceae bacterium]